MDRKSAFCPTDKHHPSPPPSWKCWLLPVQPWARTITVDNGWEFAAHETAAQVLKTQFLLRETLPFLATWSNRTTQRPRSPHLPEKTIVSITDARSPRPRSTTTEPHAPKMPRLPHTTRSLRSDPSSRTTSDLNRSTRHPSRAPRQHGRRRPVAHRYARSRSIVPKILRPDTFA